MLFGHTNHFGQRTVASEQNPCNHEDLAGSFRVEMTRVTTIVIIIIIIIITIIIIIITTITITITTIIIIIIIINNNMLFFIIHHSFSHSSLYPPPPWALLNRARRGPRPQVMSSWAEPLEQSVRSARPAATISMRLEYKPKTPRAPM